MATIKILVVEPMKAPYVKEIEHTLRNLQAEVGGYIEAVYPFEDTVAIICNEEGKLCGMKPNRALYHEGKIYDILHGTFFVAGVGAEDFCSLTDAQIALYTERFKTPQEFGRVGNYIVAFPANGEEG